MVAKIQVDCGGGVLSYGRKKRSADGNQLPRQSRQLSPLPDDLADKLTYDPNLHQDVIVYDTPLRKQIFVDPGIKVNRFTDPTGGEVATGRGFTDENGGQLMNFLKGFFWVFAFLITFSCEFQ